MWRPLCAGGAASNVLTWFPGRWRLRCTRHPTQWLSTASQSRNRSDRQQDRLLQSRRLLQPLRLLRLLRLPVGPVSPVRPMLPCGPCGPIGPIGPSGPVRSGVRRRCLGAGRAPVGPSGPCGPVAPSMPLVPSAPVGLLGLAVRLRRRCRRFRQRRPGLLGLAVRLRRRCRWFRQRRRCRRHHRRRRHPSGRRRRGFPAVAPAAPVSPFGPAAPGAPASPGCPDRARWAAPAGGVDVIAHHVDDHLNGAERVVDGRPCNRHSASPRWRWLGWWGHSS